MKIAELAAGDRYLLIAELRQEPVTFVGREGNKVLVRTDRNVELLVVPRSLHPLEPSDAGARESCGSCNADIGPSRSFPWHYENEDCRAIRDPVTPTITRDDIKLHFREDDGSVVLSVKDVDVVQVVLHDFWNGNDDYYMTADDENCPPGGFMVASWRYGANLRPGMDAADNGEYFRLWSQPLPMKAKDDA